MSTQDNDVDLLADRFFDGLLKLNPVSATRLGDHRWDDQLPDYGDEGRAVEVAACREVLARTAALTSQRTGEEGVTLEMLILVARNRLDALEQKQYQFAVDHGFGVQTLPTEIAMFHPAQQPQQLDSLLARFAAYPRAIAQYIATLREGMGDGRTSAAVPVRKTIGQLEQMLAVPSTDVPAVRLAQVASADARARVEQAVRAHVMPALQSLRDFLAGEYEPYARPGPGIGETPDGAAAYELAIRLQTTLPATADELYRFGRTEVERIEAEMDELSRRSGYSDRQAMRRHLFEDPSNLPTDRQRQLDLARDRAQRAEAVAPTFFRRLPRAECIVNLIPADREGLVAAHYWPPARNGSRPGQFYLQPMPLHMLPSNTFHETIPGHHLQQAIEIELKGLPRFRTELASLNENHDRPPLVGWGFIEGWGLYAERLADEMGLFATAFERMGMLEQQLLRAVRVVVDTGVHARGWSREEAIRIMQERWGAPEAICEMEVDRYSVSPGQALAYKVGQQAIESARHDVAERMGDRFDLRVFHDQVLGHGTLPLTTFRREIPRWVDAATSTGAEQ